MWVGMRAALQKVQRREDLGRSIHATTADLKYDFQHGFLKFPGAPEPGIPGSGLLPFCTDRQFGFHACNKEFRRIGAQTAAAFLKYETGFNPKKVAALLREPIPAQKRLFTFARSMPNSAPFFKSKQKELLAMIDTLGQPTMFATHSFADTHCPHLHRLIVQWCGLAGTSRDPFQEQLDPDMARGIRTANLNDYSDVAAYFWEQKMNYFRSNILGPVLGFTAWWERTEYQHRGSPHGHALWWHPNAPKDVFLDTLAETAVNMARGGAVKKKSDDGMHEAAAEYATSLSSVSPDAFM